MAGLVDGDDGHSVSVVKQSCLGVSWWLGAGTDERRGQVVAWSVGATSCPGVPVAFAVRVLACASLARLGAARSGQCVHEFVESGVWHDQESERELEDMVVQW